MLQPKFQYLPTFLINRNAVEDATGDEVHLFQNFYSLPENGIPCPLEDVLYVLNTGPDLVASGNHFLHYHIHAFVTDHLHLWLEIW